MRRIILPPVTCPNVTYFSTLSHKRHDFREVKVKCTLVQALRLCTGRTARRGNRGIAQPFHDHGTRRWWRVSVTPRPLFTRGKTRFPLYRRLGGPQGRSVQVRKISPQPGFDPRTVQPVVSRYTDWATRPTMPLLTVNKIYFYTVWARSTHASVQGGCCTVNAHAQNTECGLRVLCYVPVGITSST